VLGTLVELLVMILPVIETFNQVRSGSDCTQKQNQTNLFYFKNKVLSQHVIGGKEKSHEERQLGSLSQNGNMNINFRI
jgi:hypothetical protein